jgi:curved DNA-binding protein
MDFKDYYSILGVPKTATAKEIKASYRKLARKHHPDVNPGDKSAEGKIKDLNEAYEVLSDADKRKKYDELGANWRAYEQQGAGAGPGHAQGFDPSQGGGWNVNFGGGSAGTRAHTMTEDEMRDMFGGGASPFSDFFNTFFSGGQPADEPRGRGRTARGGRTARAGRDVEQEMDLGLEEAFHGAMRRLSITFNGEPRSVDVRIPAGVSDGARVRIAGEGEHGSGGGKAGDLYLRLRIAPDPQFERKGRDLYTHASITLTTAVLGGEVEVKTLGGKALRLKIPPTTQNGQVFRLKGHGMPVTGKPAEHGELYATVDVQLPKTLTPEQKEHFEALQKLDAPAKTT